MQSALGAKVLCGKSRIRVLVVEQRGSGEQRINTAEEPSQAPTRASRGPNLGLIGRHVLSHLPGRFYSHPLGNAGSLDHFALIRQAILSPGSWPPGHACEQASRRVLPARLYNRGGLRRCSLAKGVVAIISSYSKRTTCTLKARLFPCSSGITIQNAPIHTPIS